MAQDMIPTADEADSELFTLEERAMLELKAAGASNDMAGAVVNRSGKTVQRLLQRPEARALVRQFRAERLEQVVGELTMGVVEAAQVTRAELRNEKSQVRLQASSILLRGLGDLRAVTQQAAIIDELRDELGQLRAVAEMLRGDHDG